MVVILIRIKNNLANEEPFSFCQLSNTGRCGSLFTVVCNNIRVLIFNLKRVSVFNRLISIKYPWGDTHFNDAVRFTSNVYSECGRLRT